MILCEAKQPIHRMLEQFRLGAKRLHEHLEPLIENGLKSVLLIDVIENSMKERKREIERRVKDDSSENPVIKILPLLFKWFPKLLIACDVCLCSYTSYGHCGILNDENLIQN
uniref:porphobilinogen synthase n=1 Tax=Glossina brevipalpis TaxID=37001 RepID=A0A1A9W0W7_9MUSC